MNTLDNMRFFCGSSNHKLAQEIAAQLGIQEGLVELFKFSGGESYARIQESIRGFDCFVLQSIGHNPNDAYMELFILMDALKRASAKSVNLIVPHFAYGRQDKKIRSAWAHYGPIDCGFAGLDWVWSAHYDGSAFGSNSRLFFSTRGSLNGPAYYCGLYQSKIIG